MNSLHAHGVERRFPHSKNVLIHFTQLSTLYGCIELKEDFYGVFRHDKDPFVSFY